MNPPNGSARYASQLRLLEALTACCLAICSLAGCARHTSSTPAAAAVVASRVRAVQVADGEELRFPAEIVARYSNAMSFRVGGKLLERRARLGDTVRAGQILARLDPTDADQQRANAQAALAAATHRLTFTRQQLDRDQAQSGQDLIAAAQLEQTQDAYIEATAARDQAVAQLAVAQNNVSYNTLYAEHDGLITSENADTGQVVTAGQAIYGLAWSGDTDIAIDVAEDRVHAIRVGQLATLNLPALASRRPEARVREIAPAADPLSRTYRIRLTLLSPDPDERLGMTGEAVLASAEDTAPGSPPPGDSSGIGPAAARNFVIPATAIFHDGSQPAVWIVRPSDSKLELRVVSIRRYGAQTAVVSGGLRDGETVVLAGVHTVFAGERVQPVPPLFSSTDGSNVVDATDPGTGDAGHAGRR